MSTSNAQILYAILYAIINNYITPDISSNIGIKKLTVACGDLARRNEGTRKRKREKDREKG